MYKNTNLVERGVEGEEEGKEEEDRLYCCSWVEGFPGYEGGMRSVNGFGFLVVEGIGTQTGKGLSFSSNGTSVLSCHSQSA